MQPPDNPTTLFEKLWRAHEVVPESEDTPAVLFIDLHLVHEVTSPQAFAELHRRGLPVRRPDKTVATMDHATPTLPPDEKGHRPFVDQLAAEQVRRLEASCEKHGIQLFRLGDDRQGIVHVIGPELGFTQPGQTIVCGDSHTSTHGAFGALAFGIGTSEVAHVMASQCLLQRKPKTCAVEVAGTLPEGCGAKDLILAIIREMGVGGGTGHVLEFRGEAIRALSMEGRMTVCNMAIEAGARAGMIAPDEKTVAYLEGKPHAPTGEAWSRSVEKWSHLRTDEGAHFDKTVHLDASTLAPMITYGTNPEMSIEVMGTIPRPAGESEEKALAYMDMKAGEVLSGRKVDAVFIGSCTNARLSDLREAAAVIRDRKIAEGVRVLVVPGSGGVKRAAEAEGLDRVFREAGAQWREPGCSMCIAMNGDQLAPGELAVSTSNRNFEGRQGTGGRTLLASPATAAASAIRGTVCDARTLEEVSRATV